MYTYIYICVIVYIYVHLQKYEDLDEFLYTCLCIRLHFLKFVYAVF